MKYALILLVSLFSVSAFATGETMCSAKTKKSKVNVYLLTSRMVASPVISGTASFKTKNKFRNLNLTFDVANHELPGYWNLGPELKMLFYKELYPVNTNTVDFYQLKIEMRYNNAIQDFVGKFQIIMNDRVIDQGPIRCEFG